MGKAKHFKQIRRLASKLPVLHTSVMIGQTISGAELYKSGVEEVGGKAVSQFKKYSRKRSVAGPINHYRKMKGWYYKFGAEGVKAYVIAAQREGTRLKYLKERSEQKVA